MLNKYETVIFIFKMVGTNTIQLASLQLEWALRLLSHGCDGFILHIWNLR